MMLEILYEDNHLLVLNKPAGLLTQPSGTEQDSLEAQAKAWIKEVYKKPGQVFLEAVHRIDKPVSGIVVFAKTSKALSRLNASIRAKQAKKTYLALVEGIPPEKNGLLEHYLAHDDYCAKVVSQKDPQGQRARLTYEVKKQATAEALLEIELETGRYHQIRVQLAAIGCPIRGDSKYGSRLSFREGAIALHHARLLLPHPISKEIVTILAPTPSYFDLA